MASLYSWRAHAADSAAESSGFRFFRGTHSRTVSYCCSAAFPRTGSPHPHRYRRDRNCYRSPADTAGAALCLCRTNRQFSLSDSRRAFSAACPLRSAAGCIQPSPPLPHGRRQDSALPCAAFPSYSRRQALPHRFIYGLRCDLRICCPARYSNAEYIFPSDRTLHLRKIRTHAK